MEQGDLVQALLDYVQQHAHGLGAGVLFFSSLIEYIFPPFPGDVVTLFGAWLVVTGTWSFPFAMALVTAGSLVGAGMDYGIGRWLSRRVHRLPSEKTSPGFHLLTREKYDLLIERFERHGAAYILINRFLPGIRAFFFVAAGASRMKLAPVLWYAFLSALAWNLLLLGAGYAVGANWEDLRSLFSSYMTGVWILLGASILVGGFVWYLRKKRSQSDGAGKGKDHGK